VNDITCSALKVSVISCLGPLSIGMTFEMELELLDIRMWIDSKRINSADLSVAIVEELNRISAKSSSDFMHPVLMEDCMLSLSLVGTKRNLSVISARDLSFDLVLSPRGGVTTVSSSAFGCGCMDCEREGRKGPSSSVVVGTGSYTRFT
jgi:hypothetical protein